MNPSPKEINRVIDWLHKKVEEQQGSLSLVTAVGEYNADISYDVERWLDDQRPHVDRYEPEDEDE